MSRNTITVRAAFRTARQAAKNGVAVAPLSSSNAQHHEPCRAARLLALGHLIQRLIDRGELRSHSDAARRLGITEGRMTQVMNLLLLAPAVQERLLIGELQCGERRLRKLTRYLAWKNQTEE